MINIYTSYTNIDKSKVIENPEAFFNGYITSLNFTEQELQVMEEIDSAVLLDKQLGTIKTPRGITSIDHLSTGCKTAITYIYMLKNKDLNKTILDLSFCGVNALECIFNLAENNNIVEFILRHKDRVYECKNRSYLIDKEKSIENLAWI